MKKILVCGAGGFIGTHLVEKLKSMGEFIVGVDLKYPLYSKTHADEFHIADLRNKSTLKDIVNLHDFDEIYQLAADMGGAGYIFIGDNDADIMHNSVSINLNVLDIMREYKIKKVFYSSSACMYPSYNQEDPLNPLCSEESAYPANPDSEYGWEKLFSERLYLAYAKNHGIDIRIARFHNVFGPRGSWNNGKEKAPAALCRKVALSDGIVEVWGPGNQTRSFLFIDECVEGMLKIMENDYKLPINLGSTRSISINDLTRLIAEIADKKIEIKNIPGPMGVMGRNSDNQLIKEKINWTPVEDLETGLKITYAWIQEQIAKGIKDINQ